MKPLLAWANQYSLSLSVLAGASVLLLALTLLATPWLIARLPKDYLLKASAKPTNTQPNLATLALTICRTVTGGILMILGIIMFITPGPGLVMLLLGVSIAEFPGKRRLLLSIATRPRVLQSLNWMRQRHGQPPFLPPQATLS